MLLTKRPQNIAKMIPPNWLTDIDFAPANIAIGITAEDQPHLDQRYGALHALYPLFDRWPLFLSAEPLRGPLSLTRIGFYVDQIDGDHPGGDDRFNASLTWSNGLTGELWGDDRHHDGRENGRPELGGRGEPKFALVIPGGERGTDARPSHPDWFRELREQCSAAGVPFHFKQWGEWGPVKTTGHGDPRYPADPPVGERMERIGAKRAGRLLDGVIHDAQLGEAR